MFTYRYKKFKLVSYEHRLMKEGWDEKRYPDNYRNEERKQWVQRTLSCSEIPKESLSPPPTSCQNVGFQRMSRLTDIRSSVAWAENKDNLGKLRVNSTV